MGSELKLTPKDTANVLRMLDARELEPTAGLASQDYKLHVLTIAPSLPSRRYSDMIMKL